MTSYTSSIVATITPYLIGAVLASIAFLTRRWWTNEKEREKVSRYADLAQIASLLRTGELTVADVASVEAMLKRTEGVVSIPSESDNTAQTQGEMNDYAAKEVRKLDLELEKVMIDLNSVCDDNEVKLLTRTQAQWKKFRELHAQFVALMFEGGSMRPLMYFTSIETATRVRIEELQNYLASRGGM